MRPRDRMRRLLEGDDAPLATRAQLNALAAHLVYRGWSIEDARRLALAMLEMSGYDMSALGRLLEERG